MKTGSAETPGIESARLDTLRSYGLPDRAPEPEIGALVEEVAHAFQSRTAALTVLDTNQCHFFSVVSPAGETHPREVPRSETFCDHTFQANQTVVVHDARTDARFAQLPTVNRPGGYRFYAGTTLVTPDGHKIGTLCVLDTVPRTPTAKQLATLEDLSARAMVVFERRRSASGTPFSVPPIPGARPTVLVVDDDPFIRQFVVHVLGLSRVSHLEAANGAEALALYRRNAAAIGLILTDINMPVMDGLDFIRALREETGHPPVAVMSGRLDPSVREALAKLQVTCLLPKPFTGENLKSALKLIRA